MGSEKNNIAQEMLLAIEANIEFLQKEGSAQLIVRNGKFVNDIGGVFIYEFTLDFFQDIASDSEVEVRTRNSSASGKLISLEDKKIQVELDKNIGTSIPEARLVISSYYLLKLLHEKISNVESGEIKLSDLAQKTFGLDSVEIFSDSSYQIPYSIKSKFNPNVYQEEAIRLSIGSEVSFIWGPPGTGKTTTIARIIESFISKNMSVLLLSHTNKATDGALSDLVELLKDTEDYKEGKFIRVGKENSIDEELRNKFPLIIQENVLREKSLPIRNELDLLTSKENNLLVAIENDEVIINKFDKYQILQGEIKNIESEINKKLNEIESSKNNLIVLNKNFENIDINISQYQNKGFFGKFFSGMSLEGLIRQKADVLANINKTKSNIESSNDIVKFGEEKTKKLSANYILLERELKSENISDVKRRYAENEKAVENVNEQINLLSKELEELGVNLIKEARVIATTLTKSYSDKLVLDREYDCVIIDEASMAPLPALWFASGLAKQKVVIVGDFYQLPPIVKHRVLRDKKTEEEAIKEENLVKKWLSRDIFEVVGITDAINNGNGGQLNWLRQLRKQYRMHPDIADVVNTLIYSKGGNEFTLESDESTKENGKERLGNNPLKDNHIGIFDTSSIGSIAGRTDSGSYYNLYHAFLATELARQAVEGGYKKIGIITPFRPQANLMQKILIDSKIDDLVIADTVHRFQGGQKELIIFDITTANPTKLTDDKEKGGDDEKLFNVAFSRAQEKCIVIADVATILKKHSPTSSFKKFIEYCLDKKIKIFPSEGVLNKYGLTAKSEKWIEKIYDVNKLAKDIQNSKLFDEADFYPSFSRDLLNAEKEVVIDSPYIGEARMRFMMPIFQHLRNKNINVFVLTRQPSEHKDAMKQEADKIIAELEAIGVIVLVFRGQIHRKLAVIDREIVWEGSLNILSQRDSKEVMRRFVGKETASQMMNFLRLDKNIGEIGKNNIVHCEYCKKPGSWYWTDRGPFGIWTFCLTGSHKKGAPPKTEEEIKERKKTLTKVRHTQKNKTENGIPICQIHDIPMIKRSGRFGEFWGCPKYPRCKNVEKLKG